MNVFLRSFIEAFGINGFLYPKFDWVMLVDKFNLTALKKSKGTSMARPQTEHPNPSVQNHYATILKVLAIVLPCIWIYKHLDDIVRFAYNNFETFGLIFYGLFCLGILFLKSRLKNNFKKDRISNLAKVWSSKNGVFLGRTTDNVEIHLPDVTRTGHVQIIGATGRGKTESLILPLLMRDLHRGKSAILIDGKGDQELAERIKGYSSLLPEKINITTFDLGNLQNSAVTNPLREGTAQQITDRLFATFEFKEEYYKSVQYEITSVIVELIHDQKREVTFKLLFDLFMSDDKLTELIGKSKNDLITTRLVQWLSESKRERDQKTTGMTSQLGPLAKGEIAHLVNGEVKGREFFSLSKALTNKGQDQFAIVILLPTLLYQELAFKLGKLFLQEVAWSVAARKEKVFTPIFLDEFSSFVYPGFLGILNKARSSGIALHLSHQSLGDLEMIQRQRIFLRNI